MSKHNEGRDRIFANVLIGLGIAVILAVIGACIYFSYEVASPLPPSSSEEERRGWLKLLSKQEFVIDKSTRNVKLEEFVIDKSTRNVKLEELSFQTIEELGFGRHYPEGSFLECSFSTKNGNRLFGEVYMGEESLTCDLSGILLPLWLELGDDYPILVLQGREERLIFNPVEPGNFK